MISQQELDELERLKADALCALDQTSDSSIQRHIYSNRLYDIAPSLIAAARENDLLRTRLASVLLFGSEKMNQTQCGEIQKWCEEYPTQLAKENAELRKRVDMLKKDIKELEKEARYPSLPNYGLDPDPNE